VAHIEHGEGLINTDDPAALEALRHRPSHSTGPRRDVENLFVPLQDKHFSQFLGEIRANPRGSAIKLRRVLRVMEMSFVPVAMPVFVSVIMSVFMFVAVFGIVIMLEAVIINVRMPVAMFVTILMVVTVLRFVIMLTFVFMFLTHDFIILSSPLAVSVKIRVVGVKNLLLVYLAKLSHKASSLQG